jgi:hypothetical protein
MQVSDLMVNTEEILKRLSKGHFNFQEKEFSLHSLKNLGGDEFFTLLLSG